MSTNTISDFFHYVGIEETNLLKSIANFGTDIFFIQNLDELYISCFNLSPINNPELKIPAFLFTNVHREFYLASSSFLRLVSSKSFNSLRCAMDSAFTAYYLLAYPDKRAVYLSKLQNPELEDKEWKKIFCNIKQTIKNDIHQFPLAKGLPEMHEYCSIYAHSDALGIMHRYIENKKDLRLEGKYFDYEDGMDDYRKWFGCLMLGFLRLFLIFWEAMFRAQAGNQLAKIQEKIDLYKKQLDIYMTRYPLKQ